MNLANVSNRFLGVGFARSAKVHRYGWREPTFPIVRYDCVRTYCSIGRRRSRAPISNNKNLLSVFASSSLSTLQGPSTSGNVGNDVGLEGVFGQQRSASVPGSPAVPSCETEEAVRSVLEENFHELGLGNYFTPAGWIQNLLNFLHSSTGLPWWEVIVLSTIMVRTCTLPVIVSAQRVSALIQETQPEMEKIGERVERAKRSGDRFQMRLALMEMREFLKEKRLPMMKRMMYPMLTNGTIFTCYFFALRGMASKSLLSMKSEGLLWLTDLTVADPTLILPTACALSTFLVLELGIEFGVGADQLQPEVRWLMRIAPFAILLVASKMPAAVLCYWFTSNVISLILALLFRIAAVRRILKLPALPPTKVSLRESWRLPQFVRDYLSGPVLLMRAAVARFRKGRSKSDSGDAGFEKNEKTRKTP